MRDDGIAVVVAMAILSVIAALSSALVLVTMTEAQIARAFGVGVEGRYAADAAAERAMVDLAAATDWSAVLDGSAASTFTDGAPTGTRRLPYNSTLDLNAVVNLANCGHAWPCSEAGLLAVGPDRRRDGNDARWRLYAYGPLSQVLSPPLPSAFYILALVSDVRSERGDDPLRESAGSAGPGAGIIRIRGEAFGPRGAHRAVELTVARTALPGQAVSSLRVLARHTVS